MTNEELAQRIAEFNKEIRIVQEDYNSMKNEFMSMRSAVVQIVGDPKTPALKGVIERIFDRFKMLPCSNLERRIIELENHQLFHNGVKTERSKWISILIKVLPYLLATIGSGTIVGTICRAL